MSHYPTRQQIGTDARCIVWDVLSERGPLTRRALVDATRWSYASVSRALDYYIERGRIERVPEVLVCTSPRGRWGRLWRIAETTA